MEMNGLSERCRVGDNAIVTPHIRERYPIVHWFSFLGGGGEGEGDFLNNWIVYEGFQQNSSSFITYPTKPEAQKILRLESLDIVYLFIIIVTKTITAVSHFNIVFILTTVLSGIMYRVKLLNVDLGISKGKTLSCLYIFIKAHKVCIKAQNALALELI